MEKKHTFAYLSIKHALESLKNLLDTADVLVSQLTEEEKDELYDDALVKEYDLLP